MSRPRTFNAVGYSRDGAKVILTNGAALACNEVLTVECRCGQWFNRRRENLKDVRSKLQCDKCRAELCRTITLQHMAERTHDTTY